MRLALHASPHKLEKGRIHTWRYKCSRTHRATTELVTQKPLDWNNEGMTMPEEQEKYDIVTLTPCPGSVEPRVVDALSPLSNRVLDNSGTLALIQQQSQRQQPPSPYMVIRPYQRWISAEAAKLTTEETSEEKNQSRTEVRRRSTSANYGLWLRVVTSPIRLIVLNYRLSTE